VALIDNQDERDAGGGDQECGADEAPGAVPGSGDDVSEFDFDVTRLRALIGIRICARTVLVGVVEGGAVALKARFEIGGLVRAPGVGAGASCRGGCGCGGW